MEINELYTIFKQYPQITTDSRNCPENAIFFALKGDNFNGNEYALKAIESGCSYSIVDEKAFATHDNIILVDDCLKALQRLANYHRKQLKVPIIAITGTNGKTTTKELVSLVLAKEFNVISTEGNLNNHIGVPLTLLKMKKEHEIAVVEMGANHVGEIKILAEIAEPNYGLITNVGEAHLEGFGSFENIIKTKGELYEYIQTRKDGKIFIDYDNHYLKAIAQDIPAIFYGKEDGMFVSGRVIENNPYLKFEWKFSKNYRPVQTQLIGKYNLSNALSAISIGKYFGIKSQLITEALEEYKPVNNRSQLQRTAKNTLIIDAYNANPTSMKAALENFDELKVSRKTLILGDMRELGANSDAEHQKVVDYIAGHQFDKVFLVGEHFCNLNLSYPHYKDIEELRQHLQKNPLEDSYILIKGSRGTQLEKCFELL